MARRKLDERNIRKLTKVGGGKTFSITIPIELIRELKWRSKQKIVVERRGKVLIARDWKK